MFSRRALLLVVGLLLASAPPAAAADDVETLVREMGGEDTALRYPAYVKLQARKDPAAIPLIVKALPAWEITPQRYGVLVLGSYPPDVGHPALKRLLSAESPYARVAAGATLHRAGDPKAAGVIAAALGAKGLDTTTLVMMLGQLSAIRDEGVKAAARGLLRPDGDPSVVGSALCFLAGIEDAPSRNAAAPLLEDSRAGVRAMAAAFLLRLGDESRADDLAKALATGEATHADFSRVHTLLYAAARVPEPVLEAAARMLDTETDRYYLAAVVAFLGQHEYGKAGPVLRRLLEHPEANVSKAAFDALSRMPGALTPKDLKDLIDDDSPDEARRLAAAEALRRLDDASGLPVAIEVLAKGSTPALRATAAHTVGTFRSPLAVEALLAALADPESTVRAGAFSSLGAVLVAVFPYRRLDLASTGWTVDAAPATREAAVVRIRAWWDAHRAKDW